MYQNIKTIKVGTFNLMNFMLPDRRFYNGTLFYTKDEYRRKSEWVEFMLNQMNADIIGFQELFHREAMLRIIKNNPYYRKARLYMAEEDGEQPSVALLSRYPVENIEVFTHFPENAVIDFFPKGKEAVALPFTTFSRPVIKADIRVRDYGLITVFVVHLKSKRAVFYAGEDSQNPVDLARALSRSLMIRASESVALRALVSQALEESERPVILCGDVNDTGDAVTSRIISGEVPQHKLSDSVKKHVWDLLLHHVKDIQARRSYQDFYYTHIHNGMYESLDHIMVSQELVTEYPRNTGRVGLVSLYNDHLVDQTFTQQGQDKCKSDHGIVVCSLELDLDRAAKYIHEDKGFDRAEDVVDSDSALNRLDEDRMTAQNQSTQNDRRPAEQVHAPAQKDDSRKDEKPETFSVQNSLDRWKRNHSHQGNFRERIRSGRPMDENRRFERGSNRTHDTSENVRTDVRKPVSAMPEASRVDVSSKGTDIHPELREHNHPINDKPIEKSQANVTQSNTIHVQAASGRKLFRTQHSADEDENVSAEAVRMFIARQNERVRKQ